MSFTRKTQLEERFRIANKEEETKINLAFRSCFAGGDGEMVLTYLRNITFNTILDPAVHDEKHAWFQEGSKSIVYLIQQRIREANE